MSNSTEIHLADVEEFFAPMASDLVDGLIAEYRLMRDRIEGLQSAVMQEQFSGALHHFIEGNLHDERNTAPHHIGRLFNLNGAIAHLNASYWDRALKMTDVLDVMPQKRRSEWFEQIRNPMGVKKQGSSQEYTVPPIPEFEEQAVRSTLADLLLSRSKFFAERVDGIFRALSRTHVTNQPEGFSKRMIIPGVVCKFGFPEYSACGVINDLRCVIARFMGREEPPHDATNGTVRIVKKHNGQWASIDGNTLRMRIYNGVGTAHLEVHPEMAWRLNAVLASIYPGAIPSRFREKPKRKTKEFLMMMKPLPTAVVSAIASMETFKYLNKERGFRDDTYTKVHNSLCFDFRNRDKHVLEQAIRVIESVGGVRETFQNQDYWQFDFNPADVIDEIVCSGCVPDHKSHQFYPTPTDLSWMLRTYAEIDPALHECLEPSAGIGNLAQHLPAGSTCVEISRLHCQVLKSKLPDHNVIQADFLSWSPAKVGQKFDRIVMNPPFDQGRWRAHLEKAASLLADGGRLVAILPESAKRAADLLPGVSLSWEGPMHDQFPGTSVSVVVLVADKAAIAARMAA